MEEKRISSRKTRVGKVVSDKMDKTVVVAIEDRVAHPLYKKIIFVYTVFLSFTLCVQRSWTTLAGVSPVTVIASEPCS